MILDLREYESFPIRAIVSAEPGYLKVDSDLVVLVGAVRMELDIQKANEQYFCQGQMEASVTLNCARCLAEFEQELKSPIDFIICSPENKKSDKGVVDDEDYVHLKGSDLRADVSDIARQGIVLAVDIMPICSEECLGLCPQCGVNKNKIACDCKIDKIDGRWSALKDLTGN